MKTLVRHQNCRAGATVVSPASEVAVAELLDLIEHLLDYSRAGTFDEDPGEDELFNRAKNLVERYRPAT